MGRVPEEGDFLAALETIGGCAHMPPNKPQRLDTICAKCCESVTKLVLLRDRYEANPSFFDGPKKK